MVGKIVIAAAAIAVAALLLVDIAGRANTNKLEAQGPRIDPFKLMLDAKDLPIEEWRYAKAVQEHRRSWFVTPLSRERGAKDPLSGAPLSREGGATGGGRGRALSSRPRRRAACKALMHGPRQRALRV